MKKRLNFLLSLLLVLVIALCAFIVPASSYETTVEASSRTMYLLNLDTGTVVYSLYADRKWHAAYLSELMTFLVVTEHIPVPENERITVSEEAIAALPYSDNCLKKYIGARLTVRDLLGLMLLTKGSDAAYLLAAHVCGGDVDAFVRLMNDKAKALGCKNTNFISPGFAYAKNHVTTCMDMARIYSELYKSDLYAELMNSPTFIPEQYGDDEKFSVRTENSLMNPSSPFYFRYATDGKYSYDKNSGANLVVTTEYRNSRYLFIALRGKNQTEENVFADARKLTSWAYLNLGNLNLTNTGTPVAKTNVVTDWGEYPIDLYADDSAYKTLPIDIDEEKIITDLDAPAQVSLPIFQGQRLGNAEISYDGELIAKVKLISKADEGVSLLSDLRRFGDYAISQLFPNRPEKAPVPQEPTEAPSQEPTEKPSEITPAPTANTPDEVDL